MTAEFVPAVDSDGNEWWLHESGEPWRYVPGGATATPRLRRLGYMQPVETPNLPHHVMSIDGEPHLATDGGCRCRCSDCNSDGFCICPMCSRPASHAHRPVSP